MSMKWMHSFASCEMPAKYSSGKQKSRFVMFEHVSSGDSSRNGDTPLRSTYSTTPTLLQSQNMDNPLISTYSTTPTLLQSENTPTITEYRDPAQEHIQHHSYAPTIRKHSYNHRTQTSRSGARTTPLLQSQNTPTITEQRHPAKEQVHHLSYAPIIRNHSHN